MLNLFRRLVGRSTACTRTPLSVEALGDRVLLSATPLRLAVLGDSLSAPYAGHPYGAAGDLSWVTQLQNLRPDGIVIHDEAYAGAVSDSLFKTEPDPLGGPAHAPELPAVLQLEQQKTIDAVVLLIGANDVQQDVPLLLTNPASFVPTFVSTVVGNVEAAVNAVVAAGHVKLVVGTVPDVTVTPAFQAEGLPPAATQAIQYAITQANQQIETFAAAHGVPVVDLYGLTHILNQPLAYGGTTITNLYSPDYFHPNTVGQGILADTVLDALHEGYDLNVHHLRLSDQQVLDEAHIAHPAARSYFDVKPFVISTEDTHERGCDFGEFLEALEHRLEHQGW